MNNASFYYLPETAFSLLFSVCFLEAEPPFQPRAVHGAVRCGFTESYHSVIFRLLTKTASNRTVGLSKLKIRTAPHRTVRFENRKSAPNRGRILGSLKSSTWYFATGRVRCGAVFNRFYRTAPHRMIFPKPQRTAPNRIVGFSKTKIRTALDRRVCTKKTAPRFGATPSKALPAYFPIF